MSDAIGPALPPHMARSNRCPSPDDSESTKGEVGPALPPWLNSKQSKKTDQSTSPNLAVGKGDGKTKDSAQKVAAPDNAVEPGSFGPTLPPGFTAESLPSEHVSSDEAEEPIIGPLPPTKSQVHTKSIAEDFEERARKMKDRLTGNEQPKKLEREEWMTELPPLLQGFGGGPRKFRTHERIIGDRSVWTDTPADKAKKRQGTSPKTDEDRIVEEARSKRDTEIMEILSSDDSAKKESLMSMHEKERKRKAKEAEESGEAKLRRPFDRDIDLQANQFDEAAKKRMLKQSQGLSSRFSSGTTTSKFL